MDDKSAILGNTASPQQQSYNTVIAPSSPSHRTTATTENSSNLQQMPTTTAMDQMDQTLAYIETETSPHSLDTKDSEEPHKSDISCTDVAIGTYAAVSNEV